MNKQHNEKTPISYEKFSFSGPCNNQKFSLKGQTTGQSLLQKIQEETTKKTTENESREKTSKPNKKDIFMNEEEESMLMSSIKESNLIKEPTTSFNLNQQYLKEQSMGFYKEEDFQRTDTPNFGKRQIGTLANSKNKTQNFQKSKRGLNMKGETEIRGESNLLKDKKLVNKKKSNRSEEISKILNKYNSKTDLNKKESRESSQKNNLNIKREKGYSIKQSESRKNSGRRSRKGSRRESRKGSTKNSRANSRKTSLKMKPNLGKPKINMKMEVSTSYTKGRGEYNNITGNPKLGLFPKEKEEDLMGESERESEDCLFESDQEMVDQEISEMTPIQNDIPGQFQGNITQNPFLKKIKRNQTNRLNPLNYNSKLKKVESKRKFAEKKQSQQGKRVESKRDDLLSPGLHNLGIYQEAPLDQIETDQSMVVNSENTQKVSKSKFNNESDLMKTNIKIFTDTPSNDSKTRFSEKLRESQTKIRKSLQTIDLDEQEIRSSIKSKTKRKLSKFKILNKSVKHEEHENMIGSIPPLETLYPPKQSTFKKTYTKDQQSFEESPATKINKSQSMNLPSYPEQSSNHKIRIRLTKEVIHEEPKDNSPETHPDKPTSLAEFYKDELDSNNLVIMNKMTDLLSHNNLPVSPQMTPHKRCDEEKNQKGPTEMIYTQLPTESDLLGKDEMEHQNDFNMIQFSKIKEGNDIPIPPKHNNKIHQMSFKKNKNLKKKSSNNQKTNSNHISLENSLKTPLYTHKHSLSQRNIVESKNMGEESDIKLNESKVLKSGECPKKDFRDQMLKITHNNGVKKITFSSEKNSKLKGGKKEVEGSHFGREKQGKGSFKKGTRQSPDSPENESIIKTFRSMSLSNRKRNLNKNRFRCSVPLKMGSGRSMFNSFRKYSEDKAKIDREFMQNWISEGIKKAVVNLTKKISLPAHLELGKSLPEHPQNPAILVSSNRIIQNKRNSHVEYAYGRNSEDKRDFYRGSIRSLRNTRLHPSTDFPGPLQSKKSLKDNFKFFDSKNSKYYKIKLNPNQEYIDNLSQNNSQQKHERQSSTQGNPKPCRHGSNPLVLQKKSSKLIRTNKQFKEDSATFSRTSKDKIMGISSKKQNQIPNQTDQYEFTFNHSHKFETKVIYPLMVDLKKTSPRKESLKKLICVEHKEPGTHVCVECHPKYSVKCGECQDEEDHNHVSLGQLQKGDWLQEMSEHKTVDSFSLFERLELEFRKIKERLLGGLQGMIVSYKKAILENSKEFLLKGMAFRAKRTQEDFFGDPSNPKTLKKLAKQVFNLKTLRNAPFIENAQETTNSLIKSASSFHKDLELLMHTYSVTSGVITPRIKDISKSFRRNLSEMVAKIDKENKVRRGQLIEGKKNIEPKRESRNPREVSIKKKVQLLKKKHTRKKKNDISSSISDVSQTPNQNRNKPKKRNKSKRSKRSETSKEIKNKLNYKRKHLKISNLEAMVGKRGISKGSSQVDRVKRVKLYKGKKQGRVSSQDYSSLRNKSGSRKCSLAKNKESRNVMGKKESEYYMRGVTRDVPLNTPLSTRNRSISGEDPTSLSERSLSIQKKLNKKTKKPKKLKKSKKQKETTKALQKFMKKTNKFISQNRLTNTSSSSYLSRKKGTFQHTANHEYAFNRISPLKIKRGSNQIRKLYTPIHLSNKKSVSVRNDSTYRKHKIRGMSKKNKNNPKINQQKMLNLIRLSSSFSQLPVQNTPGEPPDESTHNTPSVKNRNFSNSRKRSKPKTYSNQENRREITKLKLKKSRKGKSKQKDKSVIYRSDTSPKREPIQNQNVGGFLNMSAKYLTQDQSYTTQPNKKKLRSKKGRMKEGESAFKVVYSIPELNQEISKIKKRNKDLKHKTVLLENKPMAFKIKNNLGIGPKQPKSEVSTSFRKITSKARREYMGNFF